MPKIPLVLLPGLLCDQAAWQAQVKDLSDIADCTVADYGALDSIPAMAEEILRTAPTVFAAAGHSMGGRVAFEMYRRSPDRIARLGLFDTRYQPIASGDDGKAETAQRYSLLETAHGDGMRTMGEIWMRRMIPPERVNDAKLTGDILDMIERHTPEIFAAQIKALLARPDAEPVLAQIKCPTLVLCGREDLWAALSWHEEMARRISSAKLVVIERCGHMSTMECGAEVSRAMRAWLKP